MATPCSPLNCCGGWNNSNCSRKRRAKSSARGERRSRARGQSVEFADYRNYVAGDDFRYLDWNLYGRLERLFLKLYEEERELPVRIFLDASESMTFGEPRKFDFARQVAAAMGYVALCGFDRVSVVPFPENREETAVARRFARCAWTQIRAELFPKLSRSDRQGRGQFERILTSRRLGSTAGRRGCRVERFSRSGMVTKPDLTALVGRGFQVNAMQILAPEELAPTTFGDLRLVDAETGGSPGSDFRQDIVWRPISRWSRTIANGLREYCQGRGIRFFMAVRTRPWNNCC